MRLRKKPWIAESIKQFSEYLPAADFNNAQTLFARNAPLHVELGTGKGHFITQLAQRYPEVNFIGIEAQQDIIYYAVKKAAQQQLANLRLLLFNGEFITDIFAPGEVECLYINFCDPWPKNRHAKRRLTHKSFLDRYRVILKSGGELHFKTDNEKLFEFSLNEFAAANLKLRNITFDLHGSDMPDNIMTEYEAKFSANGMKIFRVEVIF